MIQRNKRQNSDKAYVKGLETKTHLTDEKEKRTNKEKKEIK